MLVSIISGPLAKHAGTLESQRPCQCGHTDVTVNCKTCGKSHSLHGRPEELLESKTYNMATDDLRKLGLLRVF
jgi:hypothetical protein